MGIRVTCPNCDKINTADDDMSGRKIRCRSCDELITVRRESSDRLRSADDDEPRRRTIPSRHDEDEDEAPRRSTTRRDDPDEERDETPRRRSSSRRDEDDEEMDETPRRRSSSRRDEDDEEMDETPRRRSSSRRDEEDAPRSRAIRSRRDYDDDDEESDVRRKPKSSSSALAWILIIGVGVLCAGGGFAAVVWFTDSPTGTGNSILIAPPSRPGPIDPDNSQPPPVSGPPATLGPSDLQRVKQATAYLRVNLPNGSISQGTGFFAISPGVIITNAHVLGMLTPDAIPPREVAVVVHSGEPNEFKLTGTVLGVDRDNDLAVLRASGPGQLPEPLQVETATKLNLTQKLFIFGFPLGAQLGKNITVSESSVSSLRKNPAGQLYQIQVNGGMHPGNSGGPVTDTRGVVVGVSVAIIEGTQINFAIPGDFVTAALKGQISSQEIGLPYNIRDVGHHLPVRLTTLDPLQQIREVKVEVWTGPRGPDRPASSTPPNPSKREGNRQQFAAILVEGGYAADILLPAAAPGRAYWVQASVTTASGSKMWGPAQAVTVDPTLVLDRIPTELRFKAPFETVTRTAQLKSKTTVLLFKGQQKAELVDSMEGYFLETIEPDARGTGTAIRLTPNIPTLTRVRERRRQSISPVVSTLVSRNYVPSFLVDETGRSRERGRRIVEPVDARYKDAVEETFDKICNCWEVTNLQLPNRALRVQETWDARVPMISMVENKPQVQFIHARCVYEGATNRAGRREAYIRFSGQVKGPDNTKTANTIFGKAEGHARVDTESGFLAQVQVTITSEIDTGDSGLRVLISEQSSVDRVEGNPRGINPNPTPLRLKPKTPTTPKPKGPVTKPKVP